MLKQEWKDVEAMVERIARRMVHQAMAELRKETATQIRDAVKRTAEPIKPVKKTDK